MLALLRGKRFRVHADGAALLSPIAQAIGQRTRRTLQHHKHSRTPLDILGYLREVGVKQRAAVKEQKEQENDALQALLLNSSPSQQH